MYKGKPMVDLLDLCRKENFLKKARRAHLIFRMRNQYSFFGSKISHTDKKICCSSTSELAKVYAQFVSVNKPVRYKAVEEGQ